MKKILIAILALSTVACAQLDEINQSFLESAHQSKNVYLVSVFNVKLDEKSKILTKKVTVISSIKGKLQTGEVVTLSNHLKEAPQDKLLKMAAFAQKKVGQIFLVLTDMDGVKIETQPGDVWKYADVKNAVELTSKLK